MPSHETVLTAGVSARAGEWPWRGEAGVWEIGRRAVARAVEQEFPHVTAWYGAATAAWWALVPLREGARLVEADIPRELREAIVNARTWPWPRR